VGGGSRRCIPGCEGWEWRSVGTASCCLIVAVGYVYASLLFTRYFQMQESSPKFLFDPHIILNPEVFHINNAQIRHQHREARLNVT